MRNCVLTCMIALVIPCAAQKITTTEAGDAIVTTIYESDKGDIAKDWKSLMKKYDAKVDISSDKITAKGAVIKTMSSGTFDVTATVEKIKDGEVKMVVIFDPIATADSKTPERSVYIAEAKRIVQDFAFKSSNESIGDLVKTNQKAYDKLVKQHAGLVRDNENLASEIESYKKKITNDERDISMNKDKIVAKQKEEDAQKVNLDAVVKRQKALN